MCKTRSLAHLCALCVAIVLTGCDVERPARLLSAPAIPVVGRPSDGLLDNPRLQEVVDLQVARDGGALIEFLTDGDAVVRARAAFALASVIDPMAGPALVRSLEDSDPAVRRDAAFALGQFDDSVLSPVLKGATPSRRAVIDMLAMITDQVNVDRLADDIQRADGFGRDQRLNRAETELGDRLGVHLLGRLDAEEEPSVRERLIESAAKVGGTRTLGGLLTIAPRRDTEAAAVSLAVAYLFRRGLRSDEAVDRLAQYLENPASTVRINGAYGFSNVTAALDWRSQLGRVRETIAEWPLDEPAAEMMMLGIEGSDLTDDHPVILRYLEEGTDWRTRAKAAEALKGWENHPEERAALFDALSDPSHHVGIAAAKALANSPPPPQWLAGIADWMETTPHEWIIGAYLMPAFVGGGERGFVVDWARRFPTTEAGPWKLALEALSEFASPDVLGLFAEAAGSETSSLGIPATRALAERWRGSRRFVELHEFFYESMKAAFETGDQERMAIASEVLRDSVFIGTRPDVVGDFVATPERILSAPIKVDWKTLEALGPHPRLVLDTDRGRVVLTLDTEEAPLTVQWMSRFASEGRFDGVPFHRVEQDFVVQGGSFALSDQGESVQFRMMTEATQIPYVRGTLGMARANRRHTESSQFFINHTMAPHLNAAYTAWGWVSEGIEVVDQIRRSDRIRHAWIVPDPS